MNSNINQDGLVLVLGSTGKTGRRIIAKLDEMGVPTRAGSRSAVPSFDWDNESNWDECLAGVHAVYINYAPDLAMPGATDSIQVLADKAKQSGVRHLVLLSGRGEEEAQACEKIVQDSGIDWTIVRASWFHQNFSEGAFVEMVQAGQITLPDVETPEPFVDVDDIADVAVAALTQSGHTGEVYEVTGPRMLTLVEIAAELSNATGRKIEYVPVPHQAFVDGVAESGAPKDGFVLMAHEVGHAVTYWLFGYPAVPSVNLLFGGGITLAMGRVWLLVWLMLGGLAYLGYRYRRSTNTLSWLLAITIVYSLCAFTPWHTRMISYMGHGAENLAIILCLYFAMGGYFCKLGGERAIYAMLGFFTWFVDMNFAWQISHNAAIRAQYVGGIGGMIDNDFVKLAGSLGVSLDAIATFFLITSLVTPIIAFLLYRYESYWQRALSRL